MNGTACEIKMVLEQKVDGMSDKSTFTYEGTFMEREDLCYVSYVEEVEGVKSDVLLKIGSSKMSMTKKGASHYKMEFELGNPKECVIATPAGRLPLEVVTKRLVIHRFTNGTDLDVWYELMQGAVALSHNKLKIEIKF